MKTILEYVINQKIKSTNINILGDFIYKLFADYYSQHRKDIDFKGFNNNSFSKVTPNAYEIDDEEYSVIEDDFKNVYMNNAVKLQKEKTVEYMQYNSVEYYKCDNDEIVFYTSKGQPISMIRITKNIMDYLLTK